MRRPRPFGPDDFARHPEVFSRPSIFLSASEPPRRPKPGADDRRYVHTAKPHLIHEVVSQLAQYAFHRDVNLVFGGHPSISPVVLDVANRFGQRARPMVVVFQSLHFWDLAPPETRELAGHGMVIWTKEEAGGLVESLKTMRAVMAATPKLVAGVFVCGGTGCIEEADILERHHRGVKRFAIASTGGAAADLLARPGYSHRHASRKLLANETSYPIVMEAIFEDLELA